MVSLFFIIFCFFFILFFSLFCWGSLRYFLGCDLISYDLILLSLWICVLMILARESVFRFVYFPVFVVVIVLAVMLYCTCRRISLLSFYVFF